eukprot:299036-Pelagomonas_calceolata.AAC.1
MELRIGVQQVLFGIVGLLSPSLLYGMRLEKKRENSARSRMRSWCGKAFTSASRTQLPSSSPYQRPPPCNSEVTGFALHGLGCSPSTYTVCCFLLVLTSVKAVTANLFCKALNLVIVLPQLWLFAVNGVEIVTVQSQEAGFQRMGSKKAAMKLLRVIRPSGQVSEVELCQLFSAQPGYRYASSSWDCKPCLMLGNLHATVPLE